RGAEVLQALREPGVGLLGGIGKVSDLVVQVAGEAAPAVLVEIGSGPCPRDRFLAEGFVVPGVDGEAENGKVVGQQSASKERIEGREQDVLGQVARCPTDDAHGRVREFALRQALAARAETHVRISSMNADKMTGWPGRLTSCHRFINGGANGVPVKCSFTFAERASSVVLPALA